MMVASKALLSIGGIAAASMTATCLAPTIVALPVLGVAWAGMHYASKYFRKLSDVETETIRNSYNR